MESLLEPVELNRETTQALDEIRSGAENELYGAASADAEEKVNHFVLPLIDGSGLPNLHVMHYRWYLRELARHWRSRKGRDLAFHLELCIRKWVNLGLEPRTLQFLICEAHQRLKAADSGSSCPPITPITEEPTKSVRNRNLRESVESVDETRAKTGTVPTENRDATAASRTQPLRGSVPRFPASMGLSPAFAPETPSVESAESADVRSDSGILESSTPRILPGDLSFPGCMAGPRPPADPTAGSSPAPCPSPLTPDIDTAKAGKIAKAGPDSDTRPLDSLNPGVLS